MKRKNTVLLFVLTAMVGFNFLSINSSVSYTEELKLKNSGRSYGGLKNSSFSVQIMGSGVGAINGVRMGRDLLLKTLLRDARKSVYEYIKKIFSQNRTGTVNVSSGRYISFTPCSKCPWASIAYN